MIHVISLEISRLDHGGPVFAVALSPDGDRVATGSGDGAAQVFDAATGAELTLLDHCDRVSAVAFSSDDTWIGTGSSDRSVQVRWADHDHADSLLDTGVVFVARTAPSPNASRGFAVRFIERIGK